MKTFGITFLLLAIIIVADVVSVNKENARGPEHNPDSQVLRVECVNGYKFALYTAPERAALSQILTQDQDGNLRPAVCNESLTTVVIEAKEKKVSWLLYAVAFVIVSLCLMIYKR